MFNTNFEKNYEIKKIINKKTRKYERTIIQQYLMK